MFWFKGLEFADWRRRLGTGAGWCRRWGQDRQRFKVRTLRIHPLSIQIRQRSLVAQLLQTLRRLGVDEAAGAPPPGLLGVERHGRRRDAQAVGARVASKAETRGAVEEYG